MLLEHYEIGELVGRGAVGVVYSATSRLSGGRVALKVMHAPVTRTPVYRNLFLREVQSLAKLRHRSIVEIFDFGETETTFEDPEGRVIQAGSPYLVMEYVDGKDLNSYLGTITWEVLKRVVLELLDALSHAHARDVLHRDLKPQNVLLCRLETGRFAIKMVDFGLARPDRGEGLGKNTKMRIEGTPAYMSPEMVRGDVRSQGPWSDLYALGCMLWELTTGDILFPELDGLDLLYAQTNREPPEYQPAISVPSEFERWLRKLLAKSRFERYEYAADAAAAFSDFAESDERIAPIRTDDDDTNPLSSGSTLLDGPPILEIEVPDDGSWSSATNADGLPGWGQRSRSNTENLLLRRNIFRHRAIPMVGRFDSRDTAWDMLTDMIKDQRPRTLIVSGERGMGKSKLGEWFVQRVRELGLAWDGVIPADRGLPGVLEGFATFLRIDGLDATEARARLKEMILALTYSKDVAAHEAKMFANTFANLDVDGAQTSVYIPIDKRIEVIKRAVRRMAWRRPIVFIFNNYQGDRDVTRIVKDIMRDPDPLPVFMMVLEAPGTDSEPIEKLSPRRVKRVTLGPMNEAEQRELAMHLVVDDEHLAEVAIDRAEGNPVLIIQTIEDWFERGLLNVVDGEIEVNDTEALSLPQSIQIIWKAKLDSVAEAQTDDRRENFYASLEVAAALGRAVSDREWRAVCDRLDLKITHESLDELVRQELFKVTLDGWEFEQSSFHESIVQRAIESGRYQGRHQACAETLLALYPHLPPSRRITEHYRAAGNPEQALQTIWREFRARSSFGEREETIALKELLNDVVEETDLGDEHIGHVWVCLASSVVASFDNQTEQRSWLERAEPICREMKYPEELAFIYRGFGDLAKASGDLDKCLDFYELALQELKYTDATPSIVHTMIRASDVLSQLGRVDHAIECLDQAREFSLGLPDTFSASIMRRAAEKQILLGDHAEATSLAGGALAIANSTQNRQIEAECFVTLGDVFRVRADTTQMEQFYDRAMQLADALTSEDRAKFLAKRAFGFMLSGQAREASDTLRNLQDDANAADLAVLLNLGMAVCAAQMGDFDTAKSNISSAMAGLQGLPLCTPDVHWLVARLGRLTNDDPVMIECVDALKPFVPEPVMRNSH